MAMTKDEDERNLTVYFDPDEKMEVVMHFNNGELCPYAIFKDGIYKQLAAYHSMEFEIRDCIEAINYLIKIKTNLEIPQIVKSSILFSTVIKYARFFTSGEGRGTKLEAKDIFGGDSNAGNLFHKKTMDLRHEYLAHAGISDFESRSMFVYLNPEIKNKEIVLTRYGGRRLIDDDLNYHLYLELFILVHNHITVKINQLTKQVHKRIFEIPIDEIYSISKTPELDKLFFVLKK